MNGNMNKTVNGLDAIDVKREGDKAARSLSTVSGCSLQAARTVAKETVKDQYRIAVEFSGLPSGMLKAWVSGWTKGFGV